MSAKPKKIVGVIVTLVLLVQTCVFSVTAVYSYWSTKEKLYQSLNKSIVSASHRLSNSLPILLWNYNGLAVRRDIEAEVNDDSIEAIIIQVDGKIEYQLAKPWQGELIYHLSEDQIAAIQNIDPVDLTYKGNDGEGNVGQLIILPNDTRVKNDLKAIVKNLFFQSLILNASLAALILLILYQLIIKPINRIGQGLKEIAKEGANLSKRLGEDNIGELGELAKNYNQVVDYVNLKLEELKKALEKSEESAKLKSEFLACMSHEIRTPMNGVLGTLDLMLKGDLNQQQQHYLSLAKNSANSLLVIINDILDFSKIEAGKLEIETVDFDLSHLLGDIAENIAVRAQEKGLEVILDLSHMEYDYVRGDPNRVRQILNNIAGNAIKFTKEGEIQINASIKRFDDTSLQFNCEIVDTGIGIPQEKQYTLFNAFTQVDASTTRKYGGTGLGLAIVNQLCVLMEGGITIDSTPGKGSCFTISLALEKSKKLPVTKPEENIKDQHILIVDDNFLNRSALTKQLKKWNIKYSNASSAKEALSILKEESTINAALIDINMPDINGIELGKEIEETYPNIKKIMMSTMIDKGDQVMLDKLKFLGNFSKPIRMEDWRNILRIVDEKEENSIAEETVKNTIQYQQPEKKNILLVEDNLINQQIAIANIKNLGFSVDLAENGLEAIEKLKNTRSDLNYHLIFMDCQMPEMDGYQATKAIRRGEANNEQLGKTGLFSNIPIVAMTANAMKGDREKCIAAGMDDYMSKPINPDELLEKLKKWLY